MDYYEVEFSKRAEKDLRKIDTRYISKIYDAISSLGVNPRPLGHKKLAGSNSTYRIRVGSYRVIYEVENGKLIVLIVKIRHRQDAYN